MNDLIVQGVGMTSLRTRERLIQRLEQQGIHNLKVLDTIRDIPRHLFVDEALAHRAYEDTALPIGHGQTLSQPYIVARMTEILLNTHDRPQKVLEVGTGSGYQTSVLSRLAREVYTVERIKPLQDKARERFKQLGLRNVICRYADGTFGWPEKGPFDGIISTAAPQAIPDDLLAQLAPGGVLIIPVGGREQLLHQVTRSKDGNSYQTRVIEPVKFVPFLTGTLR